MIVRVECRSEASYAGRPIALHWQEERLEVQEVLASWREPGRLHYRVRLEPRRVFDLAYDEVNDCWQADEL